MKDFEITARATSYSEEGFLVVGGKSTESDCGDQS